MKKISKHRLFGFNSKKFDEPITAYALKGKTAREIKQAVNAIIADGMSVWQFYRQGKCSAFIDNHIDIMDVARGQASLKLYGSRLGTQKLQELPYEPSKTLTEHEMDEVLNYCENDNIVTQELFDYLKSDLDLREAMSEQYDIDFMSFKGAKIAELILVQECGYTGGTPERPDDVIYKPPKYIKFQTPMLQELFKKMVKHTYIVSDTGNVVIPDFLKEEVMFDDVPYKLGIGGVHASLKSTTIVPNKKESIVDIDYKSLYPSLIINNKYVPKHIGKKYLKVYQGIYDKRNVELKPAMKAVGVKIATLEAELKLLKD